MEEPIQERNIGPGSVGVVETKIAKIELSRGGLVLDGGGVLPELQVAYETYGTLAPERDNVVYICHALTGDAHVAGVHNATDSKPGWWDAMVGPGKGIDTNRFFVVCANNLGGCMGTTGPSSIHPQTGRPYGSMFPSITVGDIVHVQRLLLEHLGIDRLAGVVGGSLGGMQVLEWTIRYPDKVDRAVCIASAMSLSAQALAFDIVGRNAIMRDPAWKGGDYYADGRVPFHGLAQARMIGHITYLSSEIMKRKFGRQKKPVEKPIGRFSTQFQVESYLDHQGEKFVNRFDANSYLHITEAMDSYDIVEKHGSAEAAFTCPGSRTRFLVVALSSDWLFPPEQSLELTAALLHARRRVSYCLLRSPYGHDAFLVEVDHLAEVVRAFLEAPMEPAPRSLVSAGPTRIERRARRQAGDYDLIGQMIRPGSRVLDLGCGDGELLAVLAAERQVTGMGLEIDLESVSSVMRRGLEVIHCDIDEGLGMIPDGFYDYAILSRTLQVVRKPRLVLSEMLRVAREGIVSFPNFGSVSRRLRLGLRGRMPVDEAFPHRWYDTPDIHISTLADFLDLCRQDGIKIVGSICIPRGALERALLALGVRNAGADRVLVRISR